jgi:hypothetical protein
MDKSLVVIPTIRNPAVISDYVKNALKHKFDTKKLYFLILTENFVDKNSYKKVMDEYSIQGEVLNAADRSKIMHERHLDNYEYLIPRRSHAETSFGLLYMMLNKDFKYGFFIDDDTSPESSDYFGEHIANLNFSGKIEAIESDKNWGNVLYHTYNQHKLYPRGYPYSKMNEKTKVSSHTIRANEVYLSHGLWTNVPDLDAIRILMDGNLRGQSNTRMTEKSYGPNFIVKPGNQQTVCSMNLAFKAQVAPVFYQMPMEDNPYKVGRFDDIWGGLVMKKILDHTGGYIINGSPLCRHDKAERSTFWDVNLEAPGYESNEHFGDVMEGAKMDSKDMLELAESISEVLVLNGRTDFMRYCGMYLRSWIELMRKIS